MTVPSRDRLEIVWIEQAPLRASAAGECTEMMARLEQARLCWHQFERQDKPAFFRWRAREFGALLSTARDVEETMHFAVLSGVRAWIEERPLAEAADAYAAMDEGRARFRMVLTM